MSSNPDPVSSSSGSIVAPVTSSSSSGNAGNASANRRPGFNRGRNRNFARSTSSQSSFKGATEAMQGKVFQTHSERYKKGQFKDTLEALKVLASTEFKKDIAYLEPIFKNLENPFVPLPRKPTPVTQESETGEEEIIVPVEEIEMDMYRERVKNYIQLESRLDNTKRALYNIVWGQSSKLLQNRIKATPDFDTFDEEGDVVSLLKEIRKISHQAEDSVCIYDALDEVQRKYYTYRQLPEDDNAVHLAKFKDYIEVLEFFDVDMFQDPCLVAYEKGQDKKLGIPQKSNQEYLDKVRNKQLGTAFIRRSNLKLYGPLLRSLRDQFLHGFDVYPKTIEEAYSLLQNHSSGKRAVTVNNSNNSNTRRPPQRNPNDEGVRTGAQHAQRRVAFDDQAASSQTPVPGTDGRLNPSITCYRCNKPGHYADNCPVSDPAASASTDKMSHFMHSASLTLNDEEYLQDDGVDDLIGFQHALSNLSDPEVDRDSVLIDTGSNCSMFNNHTMLENIRQSKETLRAKSNGGELTSKHIGDLPGFFPVWFNPHSMLNILSLAEVQQRYRTTMDSADSNSIIVHMGKVKSLKFSAVGTGLYLLQNGVNHNSINTINDVVTHYSHMNLISNNKSNFTSRQIQGADSAKRLYKAINRPGYSEFFRLIEANFFRDSPVTIQDAKTAIVIYGKDIAAIQGKTTRSRPAPMQVIQTIKLPQTIKDFHSEIPLSIDVMFVHGIPMVTTISGTSYKFRTVEPVFKPSLSKGDILKCFKNVLQMYQSRGIKVIQLNGDNEFESLRSDESTNSLRLNIVAADEHVGDIERSIRTIKEGTRSIINSLFYKCYPRAMIAGAVISAVQALNQLPSLNGLSKDLSPESLVIGTPPPTFRQLTELTFGEYVQTKAGKTDSTNASRTVGAIALYPARNSSNSWYLMNLLTGSAIHRYSWTKLPTPSDVVIQVNNIGKQQKQREITKNFRYEWSPGELVSDVEDTEEEELGMQPDIVSHEVAPIIEEVPIMTDQVEDTIPDGTNDDVEEAVETEEPIQEVEGAQIPVHPEEEGEAGGVANEETNSVDNDQGGVYESPMVSSEGDDIRSDVATPVGERVTDLADEANTGEGRPSWEGADTPSVESEAVGGERRSARDRGEPINYKAWHSKGARSFAQVSDTIGKKFKNKFKVHVNDMMRHVTSIIMMNINSASEFADMSVKKGIQVFGEKAIESVLAEYSQFDDKTIFRPLDKKDLTFDQCKNALNLITFIKKKRSGKLKTRACADGRKQRRFIKKEEVSSPTIQLESLLLTLLVDASEERDVATADIAGAYLMADMKDHVIVKLSGESAEIMCKVNEKYKKFLTYEKGKPTLYMRLIKALYGCLQSALLWYQTFAQCLEGMGFKLNPYDPCVANATINGSQCTICWYVDDTKISHVDEKVVSEIIEKIESKFGKMQVKRGKFHTFVGMNLELTSNKEIRITMPSYLQECISAFEATGEEVYGAANSPAKTTLFHVDEEDEQLDERKTEIFHHIVAKLLFVAKRARLDIDLAVSFLCTRVSKSTKRDWDKLKRLLTYIKNTIGMARIIGGGDLQTMMTWVDASYGTHHDMRGHTGGVISMGKGAVVSKCSKQKLNAKSSTETEVIGASDFLPWTVWATRFMEMQGHVFKSNVFYQDNQSAMRLERNGRKSCGDKSRHIHIRFFFIKDIIKRGGLTLTYCPTERMLADYYTKPLTGARFRYYRDIIMGASPLPVEERVGGNVYLENELSKTVKNELSGTVKKRFKKAIDIVPEEEANGSCEAINLPKYTNSGITYADIVRKSAHK